MSLHSSVRVLLSAYQCAPNSESVSQIGWQWYSRLAVQVPLTLVTHIRNRPALIAAGAPLGHSEIIYIDTEWFAGPLYRLATRLFPQSEHATFMLSSMDAYLYDSYAVRLLRQRQQQGQQWDVLHVVTPVTPKLATRLYHLHAPLVLGPLNGNVPNPSQFPEIMRKDSAWLYPLRSVARLPQWWWNTLEHTQAILVATRATLAGIPEKYHTRCFALLENGVDIHRFHPAPYPPPPSGDYPLRIVYIGRLIPLKAVNLLLDAVARIASHVPLHLDIIGVGAQKDTWMDMAAQLGIAEKIAWHGICTPEQMVAYLHQAHVLCLPSVRESGGGVLLEAMACARPVIALNAGGPAELVDDHVGQLLPTDNAETVITHLAVALKDIVAHPEAWAQRGRVGRERVEKEYSWEAKVKQGITLYGQLISSWQKSSL
ncbi:glycosyl transferase [Thioflexithrix psekupsensis]|uniref:Glycosyl transferase n=1 Tax=Thioflexithrix psekupsensis TaxID=1570016 RepID=A0A251X9F7_9GAMM|nr:glycosyl transferase [Thioflexithrix psekupsensis]